MRRVRRLIQIRAVILLIPGGRRVRCCHSGVRACVRARVMRRQMLLDATAGGASGLNVKMRRPI